MDETPIPQAEEAHLRFLRRLVTTLTATMIAGVLVIIVLLVIRLMQPTAILPDAITLPDGTTATAFTRGAGWHAVVTDDNEILIFDTASGALRQTIKITN